MKKINYKKLFIRLIILFLIGGIVGVYFVNRMAKQYGFDGIGDLYSTYSTNQELAEAADVDSLSITISESDYEFIEQQRQTALDRGVQINEGNKYVACTIEMGGDQVEGELRLKGHMTDHLEGDKWSMRVKTDEEIMGMYRFSIQDPATRNYSHEWVYHQLLKNEDIVHLKYEFVHVTFNGEDKGIYAVEEHFGQHVLDKSDRPKGAILRWNPNLYWEWRIDELHGTYLEEEYSSFSSSYPEPYDKGKVFDSKKRTKSYKKGAKLLEEFRRGEKPASKVFDVKKMAAFHAVIDLVGGHHSLDWSDVKFYYNSDSKRVEPVGYESFSVRQTISIAGQRPLSDYSMPEFDYHAILFSDPEFYAEYIKAVERICDEKYFDQFLKSIQADLDLQNGRIAKDYPFFKFNMDGYYENIELIRHNLELPKPLHAFIKKVKDSTVSISIAAVSDFPIDIIGLEVDGKEILEPKKDYVIPPKIKRTFIEYKTLKFKHDLKKKKVKNLVLKCSILGSERVFDVPVEDYPASEFKINSQWNDELPKSIGRINDTMVFFHEQEVEIDEIVCIDEDSYLLIRPGQKLNFGSKGKIYCRGTIGIQGDEENPVIISGEGKAEKIALENGTMYCNHLSFQSEGTFALAQDSDINIILSQSSDGKEPFLKCHQSRVIIQNSAFGNMVNTIHAESSHINVTDSEFIGGGNALFGVGSLFEVRFTTFRNLDEALAMNRVSTCKLWSANFSGNEVLATLNNASDLSTYRSSISSGNIGVKLDQNSSLMGESSYLFYNTDVQLNTEVIKK